MNDDSSVSYWEQVHAKIGAVGPAYVARAGLTKLVRPMMTGWQRLRCKTRPLVAGRSELARSLAIRERDLPLAVARLNSELRERLPAELMSPLSFREFYERQAPHELHSTIQSADLLCEHTFDLLGSGPISLGKQIDWHRDFKSGYRWNPAQCYLDVPYGHLPGVDIKVPWELSRFQHLPVLAQAYLLTGRSQYADEVASQISDWIESNAPEHGVNWACPMEVAIRAVNWLWTLALLGNTPSVENGWLTDVLAMLQAHGRHLMRNLEVRSDGITANHYLADIVGLLYLGVCLRECKEAAWWRDFAVRELVREMDRQVLPDGVHYESSIPYHRLVSEMFLSSAALCRRHALTLPDPFHKRLQLMCEFVHAYTKPNGLSPQIGDGDNGRLHILTGYGSQDVRDHRHVLAVGAVLYGRRDWWQAAGPRAIEVLWFGGQGHELWSHPQDRQDDPRKSVAFSAGGFYIMRDRDAYVLFNCNPVGTNGLGTHKHNDLLSLEINLGGEDILVDPGCFVYTADPRTYDLFRSTASHSTVMIDGVEQNRRTGKPFCLHRDGRPRVLLWEIGDSLDCVSAEYDGYQRLPSPILHRRDVRVHHREMSIQVIDHFSGVADSSTSHCLDWTFPFSADCLLESHKNGWDIVTARTRLRLAPPVAFPGGGPLEVQTRKETGRVAPSYGTVHRAPVLRWSWKGLLPVSVSFTIMTNTGVRV